MSKQEERQSSARTLRTALILMIGEV